MTPARLCHHPDWWRVRDVMSSPVAAVAPSATYEEMVDLLLAHQISGLAVTDGTGRLLGVVTEADLVRLEAHRPAPAGRASFAGAATTSAPVDSRTATAAGLMSCPVVTASPDDDLPTIARKLLDSGHRRLPVVAADGRLVGVVSRRDLLVPAWDDSAARR